MNAISDSVNYAAIAIDIAAQAFIKGLLPSVGRSRFIVW